MASETVIDALIVRLGLDPTSYKKGVADASRSQKAFKENTKKSGAEITDSLKAVTRQVAAMVLGFESLKGAIGFLAGINSADAALGRFAANTGTSVHEVNKWGLAVEQNGGKAEELQADVANLASSITNFKAGRGISDLLALVQRAGVAIFDAEGKTRNLFDILKGTGDYLRQFNRADAAQLGRSAGLNEGTLNLLLMQEEAQRKRLADAERQNNLDEAGSKRAAELQKQWVEILQSARAFGRELLETITPGAVAFFNALKPAGESLRGIIKGLNDAHVGESLGAAVTALAAAIDKLVKLLPSLQDWTSKVFEYVDKTAKAVQTPNASDEGILTRVKNVFSSPEDVQRRRDVENIRKTEGVAAAARFYKEQQRIIAERSGAAAAGAGGAGSTTVQIDNITVHTQATDAEGIAAGISGAINRKLVIGQADSGMN